MGSNLNSSSREYPATTRCIVLSKVSPDEVKPARYETLIQASPVPTLRNGEVLVKMIAVAFNHRELWQKKGLYPGITDGSIIGCDGSGTVIASSIPDDSMLRKRVFLTPCRGWKKDPRRPEGRFTVLGGGENGLGTFSEYIAIPRDELIEVPHHLSFEEAAAWPCAGLTAYRAVFTKGQVTAGDNVLITGIGGGVALQALQLCVAAGANVYVTSSSPTKIEKAVSLGAKGGVNYKDSDWPKQLQDTLRRSSSATPMLDVIIDQGGGDLIMKLIKLLRNGAVVSCFGLHAETQIPFSMPAVLKNIELKGSTMGSQVELEEATKFIAKHRISPYVAQVLNGLENAEAGFGLIEAGSTMGKIVVKLASFDSKL